MVRFFVITIAIMTCCPFALGKDPGRLNTGPASHGVHAPMESAATQIDPDAFDNEAIAASAAAINTQQATNEPKVQQQIIVFDLKQFAAGLPHALRVSIFGAYGWQWLGCIVLLLISWFIRTIAIVVVANQGRRLMERLNVKWGKVLLEEVGQPVGTLLAAGVFALVLPILMLPVRMAQIGLLAARVVAVISAVFTLYRGVDLFAAWFEQRAKKTKTKLDDQLVPLVRKALKMLVIGIGSIFILQNLDIHVTGLLAGFSLGGVAFALAAKDTVANIFGSATIFASSPFQIGDWVHLEGVEGVVENVGFRTTRIRTFYHSLVSIPNAKVADAVVDNYGKRQYRRCKMMLGLPYGTPASKVEAFVAGIRQIIIDDPNTRKDSYEVHFYEFAESSLNVLVYFFFTVPSWTEELAGRQRVLLALMRLAEGLDIQFAFPTQTIQISTDEQARTKLLAQSSAGGHTKPSA